MPTRILRDGIINSERVNALSMPAELFYRKLMSLCDDFGRFEANLAVLRGALYALRPDVTAEDIAGYLAECSAGEDPLIVLYSVGRKKFLQINNFGQRERSSKFPAPPSSADNSRKSPQPAAHARATTSTSPTTPTSPTTSTSTTTPPSTPTSSSTSKEGGAGGNHALTPEAEKLFDEIAARYPPEGRTRLTKAREHFCASVAEDPHDLEYLRREMSAGLTRWEQSELWSSGRFHWIGNFFHERLWEEHPVPASLARAVNGKHAARAEAAQALIDSVTLENKHAH